MKINEIKFKKVEELDDVDYQKIDFVDFMPFYLNLLSCNCRKRKYYNDNFV